MNMLIFEFLCTENTLPPALKKLNQDAREQKGFLSGILLDSEKNLHKYRHLTMWTDEIAMERFCAMVHAFLNDNCVMQGKITDQSRVLTCITTEGDFQA